MGYSFSTDGDILILTCDEAFTHQDALDLMRSFAEVNPSPDADKFLVLDRGSAFNPSSAQIEELAQVFKALISTTLRGMAVVVQKDYHYGIGRMLEAMTEGATGQFSIFTDESEAVAWLKGL